MNELAEKVYKQLQKLIPPGPAYILVAFSGGPDSVALVNLLLELKKILDIEISLAYVNHNLRGADSTREEEFVSGFANDKKLPLFIHRINKKDWEKRKSCSLEMFARNIRYRFFRETAFRQGISFIATAHNFDDRIETFFLQMFRGGGLETLQSIPAKNKNVIRPLLPIPKSEILQYLEDAKIQFISDYTNSENIYKRNIIRNKMLPVFKEIHPDFHLSFNRVFSVISEETGYLKKAAYVVFKKILVYQNDNLICVKKSSFTSLDPVIKKYFLKYCLKKLNYPLLPDKYFFNFFLKTEKRFAYKKKDFAATSKSGLLWFCRIKNESRQHHCYTVGKLPFSLNENNIQVSVAVEKYIDNRENFVLQYDAQFFPLMIRELKINDVLRIKGHDVLIKKILADHGVPSCFHNRAIIVESAGGEIMGFQLFHIFRVATDFYLPVDYGINNTNLINNAVKAVKFDIKFIK